MTKGNEVNKHCILTDYRTDSCSGCGEICAHKIALHGLTGEGGRVNTAGVPKDYRYVTLNTTPVRESQAKIYGTLDKYVATFRRYMGGGERVKSLYLWSESPGTGKTTTAVALLNAWIASEYLMALSEGKQPPAVSAYFLDVNEWQTDYNLATMTKDDEDMDGIKATIKRCQRAPYLVMDDIGVRGATEAFRSYLHAIINRRTADGMPTVYTSNLPIEEMERIFDERLYDRMRDQCAEMSFIGESKRGRR